jgi:hypothetical protein
VATRLEAVHNKTDANQMRVEPETEYQMKMDAWIVNMKNDLKEMTACQDAMEANPEKMEPTDRAIAILEQTIAITKTNQEQMEDTDLKGNPEEMECELEHWEVPKEDAIVKLVKGRKKRHRDRKLAAG